MPIMEATIVPVTITSGQSLSSAGYIGRGTPVGIVLPTFTSASLSFQISEDGTTYREAFDSANAAIAVSASVGDRYVAAPSSLGGAQWIKVRSGTSGSPVNQGADRTINLVVK
jgi:hypothetical protein